MSGRRTSAGLVALSLTLVATVVGLGPPPGFAEPPTVPVGATEPAGGGEETNPTNAEQKYYVVGSPVDGQREFLFDIAARTLGDGYRYQEIFELNLGRVQPDGKRLLNPAVIEPGWILLLPPDANGPLVHIGVPPFVSRSARASTANVATTTASEQTAASVDPVLVVFRVVVVGSLFGLLIAVVRKLRREFRLTGLPAVRPAPDAVAFIANVAWDHEIVGLRLVGSRDPLGTPYRWTNRPEPGPDHVGAWVCVGRDDPGYLFVDFAATPDVVTITGDPEARKRLGASFANQIANHGRGVVAVTIVGDVVDSSVLSGDVRFVADLAGFVLSGDHIRRPMVVICAVSGDDEIGFLRELIRRTNYRLVAVVVGDLPAARWSFEASSPDYVRVATAANGTVSTTPSGPLSAKKVRSPTAADTSP
jgi:hypothetical protein